MARASCQGFQPLNLAPSTLVAERMGERACTERLGETKLAIHANLLRILCVTVFCNLLSAKASELRAVSAAALPASLSAMLFAAQCDAGMPARSEWSSDLWLLIHLSSTLPLPSCSRVALAVKIACHNKPLNLVSLLGGFRNVL